MKADTFPTEQGRYQCQSFLNIKYGPCLTFQSMSEQDQKAFKMYGKMPAKNLLTKMQKDRKYFDSGDYMMSKAGVPTGQVLGTAIPTAEE